MAVGVVHGKLVVRCSGTEGLADEIAIEIVAAHHVGVKNRELDWRSLRLKVQGLQNIVRIALAKVAGPVLVAHITGFVLILVDVEVVTLLWYHIVVDAVEVPVQCTVVRRFVCLHFRSYFQVG